MPLPTRTASYVFTERWRRFLDVTYQMHEVANRLKAQCDGSGIVYRHRVAEVSTTLVRLQTVDLQAVAQDAQADGFAAWAQSQVEAGSGVDLVTGYTSLVGVVTTWAAWIDANIGSLYSVSGGIRSPIALSDPEKTAVSNQLDLILAELDAT